MVPVNGELCVVPWTVPQSMPPKIICWLTSVLVLLTVSHCIWMARRVTRWTWGEGLQHLSCEGVAATTPTLPAEGWSRRKFCLQEASLTSPSSYLRPSDKPFQSFVAYSNNEHLFCSWICHEGVSWQVLLSSLWTSAERACVGLEDPSIKWLTHHPWQVVRGCQPGTQPQREARGFPPTLGGLSGPKGFVTCARLLMTFPWKSLT